MDNVTVVGRGTIHMDTCIRCIGLGLLFQGYKHAYTLDCMRAWFKMPHISRKQLHCKAISSSKVYVSFNGRIMRK
jgi:hypothetical protein